MSDDTHYWKGAFIGAFAFSVYVVFVATKRIFFHRLSNFPGPRLGAVSTWYRGYWEWYMDGRLVERLENLHQTYGPVVRIAPNELHFSAPSAFADIYHTGSKFTKDFDHYHCFGEDESSFCLIDPRASKARRDALNPLFSRRAIFKLEAVIQERVDTLVSRVLSHENSHKPVNLCLAFRSTTLDIITSYCFAQCYHALEAPDFNHPILIAMEAGLATPAMLKYFPLLQTVLLSMPDWIAVRLNPTIEGFVEVRRQMSHQIDAILADPGALDRADQEIVYHHLLHPYRDNKEANIPSKKALMDEGFNLLFAGSDTVGNACTVGTFHVLSDPAVYTRLAEELDIVWPDKDSPIAYESLEKLPYLTAVIKESLRMSYGVVNPLPRIVGPLGADIAGFQVPAGTTVSMGSTFLHDNPAIFVTPMKFDPQRWLVPTARELELYLVPFSRGPRACLGINLAWCEMYLIFANLFRKVDLKIYDTTIEDFKYKAYFLPVYRGKHFHAHVKERAL